MGKVTKILPTKQLLSALYLQVREEFVTHYFSGAIVDEFIILLFYRHLITTHGRIIGVTNSIRL